MQFLKTIFFDFYMIILFFVYIGLAHMTLSSIYIDMDIIVLIYKIGFLVLFLKLLMETNNFESHKYNILAAVHTLFGLSLIFSLKLFEETQNAFILIFNALYGSFLIAIVGVSFVVRLFFILKKYLKK